MMSEVHRDEVAAAEGVIGFESEGSGVWDHTTPCIIIKGMSYYADRRNNDRWRNYAAATGASAAKTLLVDYWKPASEFRTNHWIVPFQRNECFTGRQQEIKQLDDEITSPNGPRRQAILGLGGIGKTQVALELAYQLRHKDPDYPVFWIPCTSIEMIEQSYINITRILGLEEDSAGSGGMKERLKTYLSQNVTKWLLVLDNVDDSRVWRYVKDALPQSEEGRILITSRSRKVAAESAFSNILRISEPNEEAALGMLKNKLADKSLLQDESATSALLERLAYLPLAITQAAAYLNWNEKYTVSKYLELLDKHESQAMDLLSTDFADEGRYTDKPNPVSSTWFVSFNQIMDLSELAIHYLRLMACVSRHDIPDRFLPSKTSEKEKLDALGLLGAFSFVTANHETGSSTMHRLVRLVTRNWMRQNEQFDEYLAKAANGVWEAMPRRNEDKRLLRQTYLPHAMSILNEKDLKKEDHFHLIWRVAHALSDDRRFKEALPLFIDALDLRQRYLGKESPAAISSMADLASTYRNLSQLEKAEEIAVQALEMSKRILDEDDPELMFNTINLAFIYKLQGRWSEAEILDQGIIESESRVVSNNPTVLSYISTVNNMRGRTEEAKDGTLRALKAREEMFGGLSPLDRLEHKMIKAYQSQSKTLLEEAKDLLAKNIEASKKDHTYRDPCIIAISTQLARLSLLLQGPKEAERLAIQSFELGIATLGAQHPDTVMAKFALATAYSRQERWREAEAMMCEVLEGQKVAFGQDAIRISAAMFELWNIFRRQGRNAEAANMKTEAIKVRVREDVLGPRSPQVLENMHALAAVYNNRGAKADAKQIMARAVELAKDTFGSDDPRTKRYALFLTEIEGEAVRAVTPTEIRPGAQSTAETNRRRDRLISKNLFAKAWKAVRG